MSRVSSFRAYFFYEILIIFDTTIFDQYYNIYIYIYIINVLDYVLRTYPYDLLN